MQNLLEKTQTGSGPDVLPLIIDSFAGGGGASTGIEQALGRSPDVAINHNANALAMHAANHPETLHLDSNIWEVEPTDVAKGRPVGLLWASPDCKHFSKAKGAAPRDRNIRDLAWVVVKWAEDVKPDVILMENVEEFLTWGPVGEDGQPIKEFAGMTFELWVKRLRKTGYRVQWRELRGCDFGAPTIRKRFFMIARRDGRPIVWPKPTHGDPQSAAVKSGKLKSWHTAAECIDWSLPCPSIFDTSAEIKEKHGLRAKRPLAPNTLARVARGMKRYVLEAERPFIVNLTHGGRTEGADQPFRTITGAHRGEKAVVAPSLVSIAHGDSGGRREYPVDAPYGVVTAGGVSHAVMAPHLLSLKGTARRDSAVDAPHPTVLAGGGHSSVIAPILTYAQQGGSNRAPFDPMHTITASNKDQNALIVPMMIQSGYGENKRQKPRTLDPHQPLGTIVAGGVKHAPCAAFLAQHNTARKDVNPSRPIAEPISTITGAGSHQNPVAAFFAKYYGTDQDPRLEEPLHTITTKDRFGHFQATLSAPVFGEAHKAKARIVAEFLREHGAWEGGEFVTLEIDGEVFVIVDIGMRMLSPRELFNAQGFPADYVIEGVWEQDGQNWTWRPFTKDTQVSCCGNSVCPDIAEALVSANCEHLKQDARAA